MISAFRIRCNSGSPISSRMERSSSISSPSMSNRIRLPSRGTGPASRGNRWNTSPTGVIRAASTSDCMLETRREFARRARISVGSPAPADGRSAGSSRRPARRHVSSARRTGGGRPGSGGTASARAGLGGGLLDELHRRHIPDPSKRATISSSGTWSEPERKDGRRTHRARAAPRRLQPLTAPVLGAAEHQRRPGAPHHRTGRIVT